MQITSTFTIETDDRFIGGADDLQAAVDAARFLHREGNYPALSIVAPDGANLGVVVADGTFKTNDLVRRYDRKVRV